jgi:hypothetical protein
LIHILKIELSYLDLKNEKGLDSSNATAEALLKTDDRCLSARRCRSSSDTSDSDTPEEAEVVPSAVVVHLIDVHVVGKQRDDECNRGDETLPQAEPESCDLPASIRNVYRRIGTRTARDGQNSHRHERHQEYCPRFHFFLLKELTADIF